MTHEDDMNDPANTEAVISLPTDFEFNPVPSRPDVIPDKPPDLGPLAAFRGRFIGRGFNVIFRPNSQITPSDLPNQVPDINNVLELNLTKETLSFASALGTVPNRGSLDQPDVFLNGVPYLQVIDDITKPGPPTPGIHVEPGLWMIVPKTENPHEVKKTVTRMASIPHGATVCAEGTYHRFDRSPKIPPINITPVEAVTKTLFPQASQDINNAYTSRIPQDLSSYKVEGTITEAILADPNTVLRNAIVDQTITGGTILSISTDRRGPLTGGGTSNIAFLEGNPRPNARAARMIATFWIETVEHTVTIEPLGHHEVQQVPIRHRVRASAPGQIDLHLLIPPPPKPLTKPVDLKVWTVQIQYSQTVFLNFLGLLWPHVSVATLVPKDPILVPHSVWHQTRSERTPVIAPA